MQRASVEWFAVDDCVISENFKGWVLHEIRTTMFTNPLPIPDDLVKIRREKKQQSQNIASKAPHYRLVPATPAFSEFAHWPFNSENFIRGRQMVDFRKRLSNKKVEAVIDPVKLYDTLDRTHDKGPLRPAQIAVLEEWFSSRRQERDIIVKLHTGQGKTLIGLLMLQSRLNEKQGPTLYLCPNTFFVLKKEEDIIGYICILPLKDFQTVEGLLSDNKLNMVPEDIAEPNTEDPIHLYIMTMVVKAGFSHLEKRTYGSRLISGLIDIIIKLGQEGIEIKTIAARSETPDGIRLMRKLGFTELPPSGRKRKFIIDIENSGIPTIMQYKQVLKENQKNSKGQHLKVAQETR